MSESGSSSDDDGFAGQTSSSDKYDEFLSSFDHLFKDRYTDLDQEFMATVNKDPLPPPCIHPWYNKPRRNFDYSRNRRGDNRFHPYNRPRDSQQHSQHGQHWQPRRQDGQRQDGQRQDGQRHFGGQRPRW